jgi:hypothetical protein
MLAATKNSVRSSFFPYQNAPGSSPSIAYRTRSRARQGATRGSSPVPTRCAWNRLFLAAHFLWRSRAACTIALGTLRSFARKRGGPCACAASPRCSDDRPIGSGTCPGSYGDRQHAGRAQLSASPMTAGQRCRPLGSPTQKSRRHRPAERGGTGVEQTWRKTSGPTAHNGVVADLSPPGHRADRDFPKGPLP